MALKARLNKNSVSVKQISFKSKMINWAEGMDYCAIPAPCSVTKQALRDENAFDDFKSMTPGARNYLIRRIDDAAWEML